MSPLALLCPKCGASNTDDSTFCQSCGNALSASSSQPNTSSTVLAGPAKMSITAAFRNAIDLVKAPAAFMGANRESDVPINSLMINYVAVLAAVPFIGTLLGDLWYYRVVHNFYAYAVVLAIVTYIFDIIAVFVAGYIVWKLAPSFGTTTTQARATRLVAYAFTPAFLIGILDIIPFISFITILGLLYGLYILYLGMPILMNTPRDKVMTYVIVSVVATLIVYVVIYAIIGAIAAGLFLSLVI